MTKLAQDSYSQGVLDFFKTASIDPAIREAAVGMLVKEGEVNLNPFGANRFSPLNYERNPNRLEGRTPRQHHAYQWLRATPEQRVKMDPRLLDDVIQHERAAYRDLTDTLRHTERTSTRELDALRAELTAAEEGRAAMDEARRKALSMHGSLEDKFIEQTKTLGQTRGEQEALQRQLDEANRLRRDGNKLITDLERQVAQGDHTATRLQSKLDRALRHSADYRGQVQSLTEETTRLGREAREARGVSKELQGSVSKLKGHRAGLGALAALGLGYIGYDQLSGGGLGAPAPRAPAPRAPASTQPLGPPRSA